MNCSTNDVLDGFDIIFIKLAIGLQHEWAGSLTNEGWSSQRFLQVSFCDQCGF